MTSDDHDTGAAPAADSREERRQRRRVEMLDTAMYIVVNQGVEALTIANLAGSLEMSVGAIYRYFPGKDALMAGLQQRSLDAYRVTVERDLGQVEACLDEAGLSTSSPGSLLRVLTHVSAYIRHADREPERHRLLDAVMSDPTPLLDDEELEQVNQTLSPILMGCAAALERAADAGALKPGDAAVRTHILWASVHGLDHFRKRDRIQPEHLKVKSLLDQSLRALLIGWGAADADAEKALELAGAIDWWMPA